MTKFGTVRRKPTVSVAYQTGCKEGRIAGFEQGKKDGRQKGFMDIVMPIALLITPANDLPSLEIMLLQPFRELKRHGIYNYRVRTEDQVSTEDIMASDIIIFLRSVEPHAFNLLQAAHQAGKETVYVIDDNFLDIPPNTAVTSYYQDPIRRETFKRFLRNAKLIKTDSVFFTDYICIHFNPKVACFPSSVDFDLLAQVEKPAITKNGIVIGYQGTQKDQDFAPVVPALRRVLATYGGSVRLQFHGYIPNELLGHPFVSYDSSKIDYRTYIQNMKRSDWDIGLAPLSDTIFNYCKTNNKFREYSACQIPGIYSHCPPYTECVVHRESGYVVPNTQEGWYSGLCEMIENKALRESIVFQSEAAAKQSYSIDVCARNWRQYVLHV